MSVEATETDKKKTIADAAFEVFATHGFRKTSMQLIAEKAGMSRPALYLHFESKEDVFGYLSIGYLTKVAEDIDSVLQASGAPVDVLQRMFDAYDPGGIKANLLDAEHGAELMEIKQKSVKDVADKIAIRICRALTDWLKREAALGHIACASPEVTAQTIMSAYYGLVTPPPSYAEYKARTQNLAQMLGQGLQI